MQSISREIAASNNVTSYEIHSTSERNRLPEGCARAPEGFGFGSEATGLVYSQTSDTNPPIPLPERIAIDRAKSRIKRLRCSVLTASRLHCQARSKWRVAMLTTTYAPGKYWNPKDITNLAKCIREWLSRRGIEFRYVWVLEYTKKGVPHYHLLVWLPLGITLPFADKRGWWTKGKTNQVWAKNAVGYIAKYVSKGSDLIQYTPGARHHGNGGMDGKEQLEQRWWKLPCWLRVQVEPIDGLKRSFGGGFSNPNTGEHYESPWEVVFQFGQVFIQRKEKP